jgi:hypothetical protein
MERIMAEVLNSKAFPALKPEPASVARALPAVDVQDFARHEAGRLEIEDRFDDVGDFAQTADRVQAASTYVSTGCIGDLMVPGATAFTRIPRFAYSIASDLVAAFRPPFVSEASTDGTRRSRGQQGSS